MACVSNAQFDAFLDTIIELLEKTDKTPQEVAAIIRNFKATKKEADTTKK